MELMVTFISLSILFVAIPGPNVAVIVSTTLTHGKARGFATVAGTSLAMAIQLLIAAITTNWLLLMIIEQLAWLKWLGAFYLAYLALSTFRKALNAGSETGITQLSSFQRGFWISLTNPKTILFFAAFLPQFVTSSANYMQQIILLSITFWCIALLIDGFYVVLSTFLKQFIGNAKFAKYQNGISGSIYLFASAVLALDNKS